MYYTIFLTTFLLTGGSCAFIDFYYPHLRYTKNKNENIKEDYKRMIPVVFRNLIVSYPVFSLSEYYFFTSYNIKNNIYRYHWIIYTLAWMITSDILFYCIHRLFHTPKLYFLHKAHHEYSNPYGIGAIYCSMVEMVTANLLALLIPIYILDIPENIVYRMIGCMTFWTIFMSHGTLQEVNNSHVIHHRKLKCNYGLLITDRIMGTKEKKM